MLARLKHGLLGSSRPLLTACTGQQKPDVTFQVKMCTCRVVKMAAADVVSHGGLTTVSNYHLIPKSESVVDSTFMHDNYSSPTKTPAKTPGSGNDDSALVIATQHKLFSLADDSDED